MEIIYEGRLLEQVAPQGLSYEEETEWLRSWATTHNFMIYCRLREDFCEMEAIRLATAGGYKGVLADCLS